MRDQWPDHQAGEAAYAKFRSVTQGSLKVVEYGSLVQALMSECFDREITDDELASTFLIRLKPAARNFVRGVQASQSAQASLTGRRLKYSFSVLLKIASPFDELESVGGNSGFGSGSRDPPSPTSRKSKNGTDPSYSPPPPATGSSSGVVGDNWVTQAVDFQRKYPISDKSTWLNTTAKPTLKTLRCWNCTRNGNHISFACPNSRKDPTTVTIAPLKFKPPPSPSPLGQGRIDHSSSDESGNASDEEV
jgi:hypothetical protein